MRHNYETHRPIWNDIPPSSDAISRPVSNSRRSRPSSSSSPRRSWATTPKIEAARLNLSFCYITSPFDGRIGLRNVDPGNMVHSAEATPIISVTQIQPITVTFTLPQDINRHHANPHGNASEAPHD
jgi:multidrug efflux pump subunit AcrA (membrane-fusion protein)